MKEFESDELKRFLRSVDDQLTQPAELLLIGGAAAALAYGVSRSTTDIDTMHDTSHLEAAFRTAREITGLDIPVQTVGIADGPCNLEDRIEPVSLGLRNLRITVPEKHDLVLMKTIRGQENDRDAISQIEKRKGLDKTILIDRFEREMTHVVAIPGHLRWNLITVMEMLYGEEEADRIKERLPESWPNRGRSTGDGTSGRGRSPR